MTENGHVCATCCRPEVDCDIISGRNVKTVVGYVVVNLKLPALVVSEILKEIFPDGGGVSVRTLTIALRENAFEFRLTRRE